MHHPLRLYSKETLKICIKMIFVIARILSVSSIILPIYVELKKITKDIKNPAVATTDPSPIFVNASTDAEA